MRPFFLISAIFALFSAPLLAQRIRIATAHMTGGTLNDYNGGEGMRILQGSRADVILIQRFVYTTGTYQSFADTVLGSGAEYRRGTGNIPTGILSRYPIVLSGEWPDPTTADRAFSWAKIDIPGDKFLWTVSVHLSTNLSNRSSAATSLVSLIQANIPTSDYLVIGGDFNCENRTEPLFTTLGSVVAIPSAYPADQAGNQNTNSARTKPYDNLLFDADLQASATPTTVGSNSFPAGLVVDTRVYTPLADLSPALQLDSSAVNHMALLRDVEFPSIRVLACGFLITPAPMGQISFTSTPGLTYSVEASSTLLMNSWQGIGTIPAAAGNSTSFQIVPSSPTAGQLADPQLGAPRRFYRIRR